MTTVELDALPEDGTFSHEIRVIDGREVSVPVYHSVGALWASEGEPISVLDANGQPWMVGWANGVRYKRRLR